MYKMCTEKALSLPSHGSAGFTNMKDKQLNEVNMTLNRWCSDQVNEEVSVLTQTSFCCHMQMLCQC